MPTKRDDWGSSKVPRARRAGTPAIQAQVGKLDVDTRQPSAPLVRPSAPSEIQPQAIMEYDESLIFVGSPTRARMNSSFDCIASSPAQRGRRCPARRPAAPRVGRQCRAVLYTAHCAHALEQTAMLDFTYEDSEAAIVGGGRGGSSGGCGRSGVVENEQERLPSSVPATADRLSFSMPMLTLTRGRAADREAPRGLRGKGRRAAEASCETEYPLWLYLLGVCPSGLITAEGTTLQELKGTAEAKSGAGGAYLAVAQARDGGCSPRAALPYSHFRRKFRARHANIPVAGAPPCTTPAAGNGENACGGRVLERRMRAFQRDSDLTRVIESDFVNILRAGLSDTDLVSIICDPNRNALPCSLPALCEDTLELAQISPAGITFSPMTLHFSAELYENHLGRVTLSFGPASSHYRRPFTPQPSHIYPIPVPRHRIKGLLQDYPQIIMYRNDRPRRLSDPPRPYVGQRDRAGAPFGTTLLGVPRVALDILPAVRKSNKDFVRWTREDLLLSISPTERRINVPGLFDLKYSINTMPMVTAVKSDVLDLQGIVWYLLIEDIIDPFEGHRGGIFAITNFDADSSSVVLDVGIAIVPRKAPAPIVKLWEVLKCGQPAAMTVSRLRLVGIDLWFKMIRAFVKQARTGNSTRLPAKLEAYLASGPLAEAAHYFQRTAISVLFAQEVVGLDVTALDLMEDVKHRRPLVPVELAPMPAPIVDSATRNKELESHEVSMWFRRLDDQLPSTMSDDFRQFVSLTNVLARNEIIGSNPSVTKFRRHLAPRGRLRFRHVA
ncbi:hypothetical protein BDK51DRAFT_47983 [Blyttiomyces helicus]|uniref:Uncharacterized protein n=1 Tax=Blyttiomyces helicus TaxID=388810 RepID=A0A4P9WGL1_9FUNG|nr:hypothetical protein BDK51DRAFT_47983 [Blyttiomyces helicus]|eukprot:RKO90953.1 hypothetical protein BDK51DRAFT_47983 [Blyttiomyces helicus]